MKNRNGVYEDPWRTTPIPLKRYYGLEDIANLLGMHRVTVHKYISKGYIKSIKMFPHCARRIPVSEYMRLKAMVDVLAVPEAGETREKILEKEISSSSPPPPIVYRNGEDEED